MHLNHLINDLEPLNFKVDELIGLPDNFGGKPPEPVVYRGKFRDMGAGNRTGKTAVYR